jgi:hypothetical protein
MWQHPYVYLVLIFEACATFVGQLFVLCLIALFGAATTAMVGTQFSCGQLSSILSFFLCLVLGCGRVVKGVTIFF